VPLQTDLICIPQRSAALMPKATQNGGSARAYQELPVPLAIPLRPSMQRPGPYVYA
jgi:hypothetical protein